MRTLLAVLMFACMIPAAHALDNEGNDNGWSFDSNGTRVDADGNRVDEVVTSTAPATACITATDGTVSCL